MAKKGAEGRGEPLGKAGEKHADERKAPVAPCFGDDSDSEESDDDDDDENDYDDEDWKGGL